MERIIPADIYENKPCSFVALGCAMDDYGYTDSEIYESAKLRADGYLTLDEMNRYIRDHVNIRKKVYYKRSIRKTLKDFLSDNKSRAIICVTGHYIYADGSIYYSYYDNFKDEVVCVWYMK